MPLQPRKRQQQLGFGLSLEPKPINPPPLDPSPITELSDQDNLQFTGQDDAFRIRSISPGLSSLHGSALSRIKKKRTFWGYKHMRGTNDMQTVFTNEKGKKEWRCRYCMVNYQLSDGTDNIKQHLNDMHGVYEDSPKDIRIRNVQIAIETAIASAEANPQKRRRFNDTESTTAFEPDVAEILYVKFIAACNQPLRLVECPEFRAFLVYVNEDITTWLPDSHQTIRTWVLRQYDIERERIKSRVQNARSKVHISCDLWTSPNDFAVLGIVAHYISEDNQLEHSVLALVEITGPHEGENLAPHVIKVVEDWGIVLKLGFLSWTMQEIMIR